MFKTYHNQVPPPTSCHLMHPIQPNKCLVSNGRYLNYVRWKIWIQEVWNVFNRHSYTYLPMILSLSVINRHYWLSQYF